MNEQYQFLIKNEENKKLITQGNKCDKYDYLAAISCGVIGGMVDIFLVGTPRDSVLGKWSDTQVDKAVMSFAKLAGWKSKDGGENSVSSAIGFLERKFKVNYDQRHAGDVDNQFNMSAKNHHLMSLSHSPDIIGLFFSILNQFTSTSSFIADGKIITINTETYELEGGNFVAKIFCGVANWFGHVMSDIAGSSGARGGINRGAGVGIPFFELFQFCKFGKFNVGKDKQDLATIAIRAFQEGYDLRFGIAMAIPVVITDLSIRLIWGLRRYFLYEQPISECIPTSRHDDLRIMLIMGEATLCVMDGIDAAIRSKGNFLEFVLRLNLIAWIRLVKLVIKEVMIRLNINSNAMSETLKRINEQLREYLRELQNIDLQAFEQAVKELEELDMQLMNVNSSKECVDILYKEMECQGIKLPFKNHDEFNMFMENNTAKLVL